MSLLLSAYFDGTLSKDDIKSERRKGQRIACTNPACLAFDSPTGPEFKRCGKCKDARYCSRECQKADWSTHKDICTPSAASRKRLHQYIMANPLFDIYLQVLVIAQLGLLKDPSPKKMHRILIFFGLEPANAKDFLELFHPKGTADDSPLKGMMQLHAVYSDPLPPPLRDIDFLALTPAAIELWELQRKEMDEHGLDATPLCILQWISTHKDVMQTGVANLRIKSGGMDVARWHFKEQTRNVAIPNAFSENAMEVFKTYFSINAVLEYLNAQIRTDAENRLTLRAPMSKEDKEVIVEAASKPSKNHVRRLFCDLQKQKALREIAYREALRYYMRKGELPAKGHPLVSATKNDEKYERVNAVNELIETIQ